MRESDSGIRLLTNSRFAAQLTRNLDNLPRSCGSNRMTHSEQSSRGAYRAFPADVGGAARYHPRALAFAAQSHRFDVKQFFDRKRVVQLDHVEVVGRNLRLLIRLRNCFASEFGVEIFGAAVNPFAPRD